MRRWAGAAVAAGIAISVVGGFAAPTSAAPARQASRVVPHIRSTIDPCLLGTWTAPDNDWSYNIGGTTVPLYGGAGGTLTFEASGLEVDQYDASTAYVGTYKGQQLVMYVRGTAASVDFTQNGVLSTPGNFVYDVSFNVTLGGKPLPTSAPSDATAPASFRYSCSATTANYGGLTITRSRGLMIGIASTPDGKGYWTATNTGAVYAYGAPFFGGSPAGVDDIVGIAPDPVATGFWLVGADGAVYPFGAALSHGSLPALGVKVSNIVAIAPTADGRGYWLVGSDGGEFAFGDARFHGSLPELGVQVTDVVGMVASPTGGGYLMVGADGGVFAFGHARFHGSLPGRGVSVDDIVGILPTAGEAGYVLAGADGGAFVLGGGAGFYGSLPGEGVHVYDITGLALTPSGKGYWMVGGDGTVYRFGDAGAG